MNKILNSYRGKLSLYSETLNSYRGKLSSISETLNATVWGFRYAAKP